MHDLTGLQRDVLIVVSGAPAISGTDVKQELNEYYTDNVTDGGVYGALEILENKGLLEKSTDTPGANTYQLTRRGEQTLATHSKWWNQTASKDLYKPRASFL